MPLLVIPDQNMSQAVTVKIDIQLLFRCGLFTPEMQDLECIDNQLLQRGYGDVFLWGVLIDDTG